MDFEGLKQLMRDNGIVGCGGAGFPSYAKLNDKADTLVINCAECEPLLRLHRQLIEVRAKEIVETAEFIAKIIGAKQVIIGIKAAYKKAIAALNNQLDTFKMTRLHLLPEVYPAGDEFVLVYETTNRVIRPGQLPASVNVLVYNVETIYNVYRALHGHPVTHKFVTITGEVNQPETFYAPIGSKIFGLVKRSGGQKIEDPAFLIGGPMMGVLGNDQDVVTKTTNAVIVLPKDHPVVLRKKTKARVDLKRAMAACSQCSYCTDMCPRHLLGHPINPAEFMRVISNQDSHNIVPYLNSRYCSSCGVCEAYACHQGLSPRILLGVVKNSIRASGVRYPDYDGEVNPAKDMDLKRVPLKRLVARLDLAKYTNPAPIYEEPINAKEVDIKLLQHVGKPAKPVVNVNDFVEEGDLVAQYDDTSLSVNIHASIKGTVTEITDTYIRIRK